jgi:hypothetical protein
MIHTVSDAGRIAAPWGLAGRRLDWLGGLVSAVLRRTLTVWTFNDGNPRLHVSAEWLDDYARRSRGREG